MIVFFAELWLNFRARVPPYPCSHHGPYSRSRVKTMATIVASGRMIAGHDRGRLFHNEPLHPQQKGGWQHRICRSRLGHLLFASGPAWYGGQSRCTRPSQQGTPDTSLAPGLHLAQWRICQSAVVCSQSCLPSRPLSGHYTYPPLPHPGEKDIL